MHVWVYIYIVSSCLKEERVNGKKTPPLPMRLEREREFEV